MSMIDDVRFWLQIFGDAKRTIIVPPDLESRAIETVKARGLAHIVTVRVSPYIPEDMAYVVDEQALDVDVQRPLGKWRV